MNPVFVVEETLPSGLRYTEETNRIERSLPMRDCLLWQAGVDEPVSGLNVVPFRQRFGAAAIPAEGIGGVETLPAHRRMGHMGTLMTRALAGISSRVPVVFVADAIDHAYKKYGFVNCLAESDLTLHVRDIERMAKQMPISAGLCVNFRRKTCRAWCAYIMRHTSTAPGPTSATQTGTGWSSLKRGSQDPQ